MENTRKFSPKFQAACEVMGDVCEAENIIARLALARAALGGELHYAARCIHRELMDYPTIFGLFDVVSEVYHKLASATYDSDEIGNLTGATAITSSKSTKPTIEREKDHTDTSEEKPTIECREEIREQLDLNGVSQELEIIVGELYVIRHALMAIGTDNIAFRDGLSNLLETVSCKILDLAHGRGPGDPLPE